MIRYRVDMAFYVLADDEYDAVLQVENEISAQLAVDYDFVDVDVAR